MMSSEGRLAVSEIASSPATLATRSDGAPSGGLRALAKLVREHWEVILLAAVVIAVFASVLPGLVQDWWEKADYSHGFFVPMLSAYLVWRKRDELAGLARRPNFAGMFLVAASIGMLFLGSLGAELYLSRVAFVGTLAGLIVYFLGWQFLRKLAFPVAFLLFMIPLPVIAYNELVFPLQLLASRFATSVLDVLNLFPVVREGNILALPHSRLEVVEACSGIRSLMSLTALALGYGYLGEKNRWIRAVLAIAMVPLAVVSNGLRVVVTAIMAYYIGLERAEGALHSFSGWLIFIVATLLLLAVHGTINVSRKVLFGGDLSREA